MKRLIQVWDTYKTVIDDAKECYLRAQERGSSDPIDFAAPFVYQQIQRNPQGIGGRPGMLLIGAYISAKYPHLHEDIIGKVSEESKSKIEELVKEVFDEPERTRTRELITESS